MAGAALIVVGSIGMVAWAWTAVRTQQVVGPVGLGFGGDFEGPAPSLAQRIDLAAGVYVLVASAGASPAIGPGIRSGTTMTVTTELTGSSEQHLTHQP